MIIPPPPPPNGPTVLNANRGDTIIIDGVAITVQCDGVYEIRGCAARVTLVALVGCEWIAEITKGVQE